VDRRWEELLGDEGRGGKRETLLVVRLPRSRYRLCSTGPLIEPNIEAGRTYEILGSGHTDNPGYQDVRRVGSRRDEQERGRRQGQKKRQR